MLLALTAGMGGEFTRNLTPEKLRASGLVKLTPEEIAKLETLIENYKTGAVEQAVAAVPPAPPAPAVKPAPEAKSSKILPAWVGALLTLERIRSKGAEPEAMESRIKGEFSGWEKRTLFRLENGQVWTQVNDDSYVHAPVLQSPRVKIYPGTFGTFWLEIEGVNQRSRVKPTKLE